MNNVLKNKENNTRTTNVKQQKKSVKQKRYAGIS